MDPITTEFVLSAINHLQTEAFHGRPEMMDLFSYIHEMRSYRNRLTFMHDMNTVLSLTSWFVDRVNSTIPEGMEVEYVVTCYVICIKYLFDEIVDEAMIFNVKLSKKIFDLYMTVDKNPFDMTGKQMRKRGVLDRLKSIEIKVLERVDYTLPGSVVL